MKDKVQKIREEIAKKLEVMQYQIHRKDAYKELKSILNYMDSLQDEPVRRTSTDIESAMQEVEEKSKAFTEAHKGESSNEILAEMRGEEPVSEELEEEIDNYIKRNGYDGLDSIEEVKYIANHFAEWQKEQFEKNRLAACDRQTEEEAEIERDFVTSIIEKEHRQPTFDDAIKYGMRLQKEQMTAKAGNGRVDSVSNRQTRAHITVAFDSPRDIEVLDRLKVIVIKED